MEGSYGFMEEVIVIFVEENRARGEETCIKEK